MSIIEKESLPERAPKQGKDDLFVQSHNQAHPADARPEDFQPIKDEQEFSGQCGDSQAEYEKLLKVGPAARKNPDPRA